MKRDRLISMGFVATGLLLGGLGGNHRFHQVYSPESECVSCHLDEEVMEQQDTPPSHSTDYYSMCHACHVLGIEAYVTAGLGTIGLGPPEFVRGMEDPVIAGQTCMGCHMSLGRRDMPCELCHDEGKVEVQIVQNCAICHADQLPLPPHHRSDCQDCHLESIADPRGRANMLLVADLRKKEGYRYGDFEYARTSMRTVDQEPEDGVEEAPEDEDEAGPSERRRQVHDQGVPTTSTWTETAGDPP